MAPLVHMVFRKSRTVRNVLLMSCMLELAQEDVSTALDLAAARVEALLRASATRTKAMLFDRDRSNWPAGCVVVAELVRSACRRVSLLRPALFDVAWFALPMSVVAGACAWLLGLQMDMAGL